jgi:hypothetical protein
MTKDIKIEAKLADRVKADNEHLAVYPELSKQDIEMLHWAVEGDFRMMAGERPLTITSYGTDGNIDEYLWSQLMGLHNKFPNLLAGDEVEQTIIDNPGTIRILPQNDEVVVIFVRPMKDGTNTYETTALVTEFGSALVEATDLLISELTHLNSKLANADIVNELSEANARTKQLL